MLRNIEVGEWVAQREERKRGSEMGPSGMMRRVWRSEGEIVGGMRFWRVDWRRVAEEVGRIRVAVVVRRRRGMRTRPMLPEAEVRRIF